MHSPHISDRSSSMGRAEISGIQCDASHICEQEKLRLKARQERFKDQLTKMPASTTGNSKPTAAGASDIEAKKKVRRMPAL